MLRPPTSEEIYQSMVNTLHLSLSDLKKKEAEKLKEIHFQKEIDQRWDEMQGADDFINDEEVMAVGE